MTAFDETLEPEDTPPANPISQWEQQIIAFLVNHGLPKPIRSGYYMQALTHSSYSHEGKRSALDNYERLEFLGDAVLKLAVSQLVYERFPYYREGELTKIRSVVVSDAVLAPFAVQLGLGEVMRFGPAEKRSGGANKPSNLACGFEALLGALYLDGFFNETVSWLKKLLENVVDDVDQNKTKDNYKAALQEYTQGMGWGLPEYHTLSEHGPAHNRAFEITVSIAREVMGVGHGKTKKEAQQSAAKQALQTLGELPVSS
ncbi:MAG: ribonuclease III [Vampirovibrionales bacterium]|nr:ribonuclease III [Vampirovibrionales bacterium]